MTITTDNAIAKEGFSANYTIRERSVLPEDEGEPFTRSFKKYIYFLRWAEVSLNQQKQLFDPNRIAFLFLIIQHQIIYKRKFRF